MGNVTVDVALHRACQVVAFWELAQPYKRYVSAKKRSVTALGYYERLVKMHKIPSWLYMHMPTTTNTCA